MDFAYKFPAVKGIQAKTSPLRIEAEMFFVHKRMVNGKGKGPLQMQRAFVNFFKPSLSSGKNYSSAKYLMVRTIWLV